MGFGMARDGVRTGLGLMKQGWDMVILFPISEQ